MPRMVRFGQTWREGRVMAKGIKGIMVERMRLDRFMKGGLSVELKLVVRAKIGKIH